MESLADRSSSAESASGISEASVGSGGRSLFSGWATAVVVIVEKKAIVQAHEKDFKEWRNIRKNVWDGVENKTEFYVNRDSGIA